MSARELMQYRIYWSDIDKLRKWPNHLVINPTNFMTVKW